MTLDFLFDPTSDKSFENIKNGEGDDRIHLNKRISELLDNDILIAIDHYQIYDRTGNWPVVGTLMHDIYIEYFKDLGCPEWEGIQQSYDLICREFAKRSISNDKNENRNKK